MLSWESESLRTAIGFLLAPLTVAVLLAAYGLFTGAAVATSFILFCVAVGYVAALLFGLPLHICVLRRTRRRGVGFYAAAGAATGLAAYALIATVLWIPFLLSLRLGDFFYAIYLSRGFASLGAICGGVSALVFWLIAVRGRDGP